MQMNPYLTFNGQCEAAFKFYEKCLSGKIVMMLANGGSPMADQVPADRRDKILHARLNGGRRGIDGVRRAARALRASKGIFRDARHLRSRRCRAHFSRSVTKWDGADADPEDLLGRPVLHAGR